MEGEAGWQVWMIYGVLIMRLACFDDVIGILGAVPGTHRFELHSPLQTRVASCGTQVK